MNTLDSNIHLARHLQIDAANSSHQTEQQAVTSLVFKSATEQMPANYLRLLDVDTLKLVTTYVVGEDGSCPGEGESWRTRAIAAAALSGTCKELNQIMRSPLNNLRIPTTISGLPDSHSANVFNDALSALSPVVQHIFSHNNQSMIGQFLNRMSNCLTGRINDQALVRRSFTRMPCSSARDNEVLQRTLTQRFQDIMNLCEDGVGECEDDNVMFAIADAQAILRIELGRLAYFVQVSLHSL
jgi:hypothetical protein